MAVLYIITKSTALGPRSEWYVRLELRNAYLLHWTDIHPIRTEGLFGRHGITETEFERNSYGGCGILFSNNGILLRKPQLRTDT